MASEMKYEAEREPPECGHHLRETRGGCLLFGFCCLNSEHRWMLDGKQITH